MPKSGIIEGTLDSEETTPYGNDALASRSSLQRPQCKLIFSGNNLMLQEYRARSHLRKTSPPKMLVTVGMQSSMACNPRSIPTHPHLPIFTIVSRMKMLPYIYEPKRSQTHNEGTNELQKRNATEVIILSQEHRTRSQRSKTSPPTTSVTNGI